jgi:four helix bundle protein
MADKVRDYRDLVTWQRAMDLVVQVYPFVRKLPAEETYALGAQIRRSVVSIAVNVAEGHARQHTREFLQHLSMARGSLAEVWTLLVVAVRMGYLTANDIVPIEASLSELRRLLFGLTAQLRRRL